MGTPVLPWTIELPAAYGPLHAGWTFDVPAGYASIVGANNSGKSSLLQFVFRQAISDGNFGLNKVSLLTPDRLMLRRSAEVGGRTLEAYNRDLLPELKTRPLSYDAPRAPDRSELGPLLLQDADFHDQLGRVMRLLERLGFPRMVLQQGQSIFFDQVAGSAQGSGLRALLPILAALTNDALKLILIDEPEASLEPALQRDLRELLIRHGSEHRAILVATHSHLMLDRERPESIIVMQKGECPKPLASLDAAHDVVFTLLGNSTEDLFLPGNYLVVEGASDQVLMERVIRLSGARTGQVKVLAAGGVTEVEPLVTAVTRVLRPLIVRDSPYAKRIVAMIDAFPDSENLGGLRKALGKRLIELDAPSMEAYLPAQLYEHAGESKDAVLNELHSAGSYADAAAIKERVSRAIAGALSVDDFALIPRLVLAAETALAPIR